jgi:hypothetical protein
MAIDVQTYISSFTPPPVGRGNLFHGDHVNFINGKAADPKITGYAVVMWLKLPPWFDKSVPWFNEAFQKNVLSFAGLSDVALEKAEVNQGGFTGETYQIVTGVKRGNKEFTVGYKEYARDPMNKAYGFWARMIRCPYKGTALYPHVNFDGERYPYTEANHTGVALYATLRPDAYNLDSDEILETSVQNAYIWTHVTPNTMMKLDSENYTGGTHDQVDSEQQFTGVFHEGPHITKFAIQALRNHTLLNDLRDDFAYINTEDFRLA